MSEKKSNWVDKANLASNVIQNFQLEGVKRRQEESNLIQSQIASAEAERVSIERKRLSQEELEDQIREAVFWGQKTADDLRNRLNATLSEAPAIAFQARLIYNQYKAGGFDTGSVRAYGDKERIHQMYESFAKVAEQAEAQLSAEKRSDLERALRYYRRENPELAKLIAAESKLPELASMKRALQQATVAVIGHTRPKMSGLDVVSVVLIVLGAVGVTLGMTLVYVLLGVDSKISGSDTLGATAACGIFIGGFFILIGAGLGAVSGRKKALKKSAAELACLKAKEVSIADSIRELEDDLGNVDLDALREKFGKGKSVTEYQQMLDDRRTWLAGFVGYPPPPPPPVAGCQWRDDGIPA